MRSNIGKTIEVGFSGGCTLYRLGLLHCSVDIIGIGNNEEQHQEDNWLDLVAVVQAC